MSNATMAKVWGLVNTRATDDGCIESLAWLLLAEDVRMLEKLHPLTRHRYVHRHGPFVPQIGTGYGHAGPNFWQSPCEMW
jgi:hypothetical protein